MMQKTVSIFINSAGVLLLALASMLFLINWTSPPDSVQPHDPIFLLPLNNVFWIIGGIFLVMGLICLFSDRPNLTMLLLAWLAIDFLVCRLGFFWEGCHGLTGFFGGFTYAFGLSSKAASVLADVFFAYLLIGSCVAFWIARRLPPPTDFQKMSCPACGGHIQFELKSLGSQTACPHCKVAVTLRRPEEMIKTFCYFCKGHIEFPAHAVGQKLKCPHCHNDITLKEPAIT